MARLAYGGVDRGQRKVSPRSEASLGWYSSVLGSEDRRYGSLSNDWSPLTCWRWRSSCSRERVDMYSSQCCFLFTWFFGISDKQLDLVDTPWSRGIVTGDTEFHLKFSVHSHCDETISLNWKNETPSRADRSWRFDDVLMITSVNWEGNSAVDTREIRICWRRGAICCRSASVAGVKIVIASAIRLGRKFTEPNVKASMLSVIGKLAKRALRSLSRASWTKASDVSRITRARCSRNSCRSYEKPSRLIVHFARQSNDLLRMYSRFPQLLSIWPRRGSGWTIVLLDMRT